MATVDLRSDTITQPTDAMRRAMAEAKVGDDVFGEDPTINKLEKMAAAKTGKEAALFVASGSMANLVSLLTHCGRGDEIILGDQSHVFYYEQGSSAAVGGVHPRTVPNLPDGTIHPDDIESAIRQDNVHYPRTRLIVLENTHNRCNGRPLNSEYMRGIGNLAHLNGLKVHVDGARIFNASVSLGEDVQKLVFHADSLSFCLSKGLGAPAGSMVCGTCDFIEKARRARKLLGGGMRQAGILAAAGIVAIDEMVDRLAEDHANARLLAEGLAGLNGLLIDPEIIKTNIVYFNISRNNISAEELSDRMRHENVLLMATGPMQLRAVTNYHITSEDIGYVLSALQRILK